MRDIDLRMRRVAAIKLIVEQLEDTGKTKLQKLLYFTQEAVGAPLEYKFRMHHYGPFAEDIENDISFLKVIGHLDVQPDTSGFGYHIRPASFEPLPWDEELEKFKGKMTETIDKLGMLDISELELSATVHFVQQLLKEPTRESVIENVSRLKPRFSPQTIRAAYNKLVEANLMSAAPGS